MEVRKLNKREKYMVSVLLTLVLIYSYFYVVLLPNLNRITELQSELNAKRLVSEDRGKTAKALKDLDERIGKSRSQLAEIERKIPRSIRTPELIVDFDSEIKRLGMNLKSISVGEADGTSEEYGIIPVNVTFEGNYDGVMEFIRYIENKERKFIIDSFSISPENRRTPMTVSINMRTFVMGNTGKEAEDEPSDYYFFKHENGKEYPFLN